MFHFRLRRRRLCRLDFHLHPLHLARQVCHPLLNVVDYRHGDRNGVLPKQHRKVLSRNSHGKVFECPSSFGEWRYRMTHEKWRSVTDKAEIRQELMSSNPLPGEFRFQRNSHDSR
jgi:hypothetical protein